jgi:hypothetical protein
MDRGSRIEGRGSIERSLSSRSSILDPRSAILRLAALLLPCALAAPAAAQAPGGPNRGEPVTQPSGTIWGASVSPQGGPRWQTNAPPANNLPIPAAPVSPPVIVTPLPTGSFPAPDVGPAPGSNLPPPVFAPVPQNTARYPQNINPAPRGALPAPGGEKTYLYTRDTNPPGAGQPGLYPTVLQKGGKVPERLPAPRPADEVPDYNIRLDVPGFQRLIQLESEAQLYERMRQEARARGERLVFPDEPVLSREPFVGRHWSPLTREVEPYYVNYARLLFQQKNFERYGWDLGAISPLLSAGKFFADVALLPYHLGTRPLQQYETSAGYCLPGDPVPLLLYPEEISVTGLAAEAAVITLGFFIFP